MAGSKNGNKRSTKAAAVTAPVEAAVEAVAPVVLTVEAAVAPVAPVEAAVEAVTGKKPLNAYQQFVNEKVNELKGLAANDGKKYMELRALANAEWRILHPATAVDENKPKRVYKKKEKDSEGDEASTSSESKTKKVKATKSSKDKEPKEPKEKRAPTAYNLFIKSAFAELNEEFKDKEHKPTQTEMMKLAAERWRQVKATL